MCATVFYRKWVKGRLYPKAARTGPYVYANEVSRDGGRVVSKYVGIVKVPDIVSAGEDADVVENLTGTNIAEKPEEGVFEIEADSAESFTPLSITGRWKRTKLPRKVSLYVDGVSRAGAEALATPVSDNEGGYTIVFLPTAADIGLRELEVRIEGEEKPIYRKKVEVKVRGAKSLEMKKVG